MDHTCLQHLNFQLMERDGITNPILRGRSLGQQFIVDQYAKIELARLRYVELHQKELRAEIYSGAKDAMRSNAGLEGIGKRVILPSSFLGGRGTCISRAWIQSHYTKHSVILTFSSL